MDALAAITDRRCWPAPSAGLMGVGGGILFVPALVIFLDQSQLHAEATSLLAIIPVAVVGTWRQYGYGNVRLRQGIVIGVLSPLGVLAGTVIANSVPERALEIGFAVLVLARGRPAHAACPARAGDAAACRAASASPTTRRSASPRRAQREVLEAPVPALAAGPRRPCRARVHARRDFAWRRAVDQHPGRVRRPRAGRPAAVTTGIQPASIASATDMPKPSCSEGCT